MNENKRITPIQVRLTKEDKQFFKKIVDNSEYKNIYEYVNQLVEKEKRENNLIKKDYEIKDDKLSFRTPTEREKEDLLGFAKKKGYTFAEFLTALIEKDIEENKLKNLNANSMDFHIFNIENAFNSLKLSLGREKATIIINNILKENNFNDLSLVNDRLISKK